MKKLVGVMILGLLLVPWPAWGVPVFGPHLRGVLPPDEIAIAAPMLMMVTVYPLIGLLALVTLGYIERMERQTLKTVRDNQTQRARDYGPEFSAAQQRKHERKRQNAKHRAQQEGALLITLAMLGDNNKK